MRLLIGILLLVGAQIGVFFQLFAPLKYTVLKTNWWLYLIAIPIVWGFSNGTRITGEELGNMWGVNIVTFVSGIVVFTLLNNIVFNEAINLKTGICLLLAFIIVAIQTLWK